MGDRVLARLRADLDPTRTAFRLPRRCDKTFLVATTTRIRRCARFHRQGGWRSCWRGRSPGSIPTGAEAECPPKAAFFVSVPFVEPGWCGHHGEVDAPAREPVLGNRHSICTPDATHRSLTLLRRHPPRAGRVVVAAAAGRGDDARVCTGRRRRRRGGRGRRAAQRRVGDGVAWVTGAPRVRVEVPGCGAVCDKELVARRPPPCRVEHRDGHPPQRLR